MDTQTRHTLIGMGGIFACVLVVASLVVGNAPGQASRSYIITGEFRSAEGVALGAPVSLGGIQIGTVSHVAYNADNQTVMVDLSIKNGTALSTDSLGMIVSDGFFGGKYVKIIPGGMPDMLEQGDSLEYVQDSVNLKELLEQIVDRAGKK